MSVDIAEGQPKLPQSWNRYAYALGNPVRFVDPDGLEAMEPVVQQFLEAFFGTSLSHIEVVMGLKGQLASMLARGFPAVTLGSTVYLSIEADAEYASGSVEGVSMMAHEVVHTFDYNARGTMGFLGTYALEANSGFVKTQSLNDAYDSVSFEVRAEEVENLATRFLAKNPDIQGKIAKGETLAKEEVERIQNYAIGLVSRGKLRHGLQFINGRLTYVRLSVK